MAPLPSLARQFFVLAGHSELGSLCSGNVSLRLSSSVLPRGKPSLLELVRAKLSEITRYINLSS